MPDWSALLQARLKDLALPPDEQSEVFQELADYLDEFYQRERTRGTNEVDAMARALAELGDETRLARDIRCAKRGGSDMSDSMKQFWLPAFATIVVVNLMWSAVTLAGIPPDFFELGVEAKVPLYTVMFFGMPIVGAVGAYLSRHAGASRRMIVASGLFPALAMPLAAAGLRIIGSLLRWPPAWTAARSTLTSSSALFLFVILTLGLAVCLLPGVLPFVRDTERRPLAD